jgi:hypothetical protein
MITNKFKLPAPLVSAVKNDPYTMFGDISTTTLIGPPRIRELRKRHKEDITEDVSELIYALIGNNTHSILERVDVKNVIREERFSTYVSGWVVSGQVDLYEKDTQTHSDYKVTSVWAVINGVKPEWENQLNINSYLLQRSGHVVKHHQIVALLRDWSKFKAKEDTYPSCQVKVVPVCMWDDPMKYIKDRVLLHQSCIGLKDDDLPPCAPEEMWEEPTKYAVMKKGRKSAVRVLGSMEDAEKYMEDKGLSTKIHSITVRPGSRKRCDSYCNVNQWCNRYKEYKNARG